MRSRHDLQGVADCLAFGADRGSWMGIESHLRDVLVYYIGLIVGLDELSYGNFITDLAELEVDVF